MVIFYSCIKFKKDCLKYKGNDSVPLFYVFNFEDNKGFVIVTTEDNYYPVLGISDQGNFNENDVPPALENILELHKKNIAHIKKEKIENEKHKIQWDKLKDKTKSAQKTDITYIVEQQIFTNWHQIGYYDDFCPVNTYGRSVTGCGAVAFGQLLKYYQYPIRGYGSSAISFDDPDTGSNDFGTYSVYPQDFEANYSSMPNSVATSNSHVAEFLAHLGKTMKTDYDLLSARSDLSKVYYLLRDKYGFDIEYSQYSSGVDWTDMWGNKSLPWVYGGIDIYDSNKSHGFLIDGVRINGSDIEMHVNWGWGGSYDGWYTEMNVKGSYYNSSVLILHDIVPDPELHYTVNGVEDVFLTIPYNGSITLDPVGSFAKAFNFRIRESNYSWEPVGPVYGDWMHTQQSIDVRAYAAQLGLTLQTGKYYKINYAVCEPDCWIGKEVLIYLSNSSKSLEKTKLVQSDVNLYPNPAKEKVMVTTKKPGDYNIFVLNSKGQLILNKQVHDKNYVEMNISGFSEGIYIMNIYGNNEKITKKFVVNN